VILTVLLHFRTIIMPALKMPAFARSIAKAGSVVAPVPHRNIIAISGSQASEFLHGILASGVGQRGHLPFFSAFLNAQVREYNEGYESSSVILLFRAESCMMSSFTRAQDNTLSSTTLDLLKVFPSWLF